MSNCRSTKNVTLEDKLIEAGAKAIVHCEHREGHGPEHSGRRADGTIEYWREEIRYAITAPEAPEVDPAVRCAESKVGKPRFDLIPPGTLEAAARVMTFGAKKHAADSWRRVPDGDAVYYSALMRHLERWRAGETIDAESGEHPLAHVIADALILLGRQGTK